VARANTAVGVSPETFLLLLLQSNLHEHATTRPTQCPTLALSICVLLRNAANKTNTAIRPTVVTVVTWPFIISDMNVAVASPVRQCVLNWPHNWPLQLSLA
jgi:hypothetical protein